MARVDQFTDDRRIQRHLLRKSMRDITVSFLAVALLAAGVGPLAAQVTTAPAGLPSLASRMYTIVKTPVPGELKWQEIPWLVELQDGLRLARDENRPLLLWVSGDDPLEKC